MGTSSDEWRVRAKFDRGRWGGHGEGEPRDGRKWPGMAWKTGPGRLLDLLEGERALETGASQG